MQIARSSDVTLPQTSPRVARGHHQLHRVTWLPIDVERAFSFFCNPFNLQRITPPELDFVVTEPPEGAMTEGVEIGYRLKLWGMPFRWRSRIQDWSPPSGFVDTALTSPYRLWHHRHLLVPEAGGTTMVDLVDYALPLWPFGEFAHPIVRRQLERIFDYREHTIRELTSDGTGPRDLADTGSRAA